jgi:hypothetical protein
MLNQCHQPELIERGSIAEPGFCTSGGLTTVVAQQD